MVSLLVAASLLSQTGNATNHTQLQPIVTTVASTQRAAPGTAITDTVTVAGPVGSLIFPTGTVTFNRVRLP